MEIGKRRRRGAYGAGEEKIRQGRRLEGEGVGTRERKMEGETRPLVASHGGKGEEMGEER